MAMGWPCSSLSVISKANVRRAASWASRIDGGGLVLLASCCKARSIWSICPRCVLIPFRSIGPVIGLRLSVSRSARKASIRLSMATRRLSLVSMARRVAAPATLVSTVLSLSVMSASGLKINASKASITAMLRPPSIPNTKAGKVLRDVSLAGMADAGLSAGLLPSSEA